MDVHFLFWLESHALATELRGLNMEGVVQLIIKALEILALGSLWESPAMAEWRRGSPRRVDAFLLVEMSEL